MDSDRVARLAGLQRSQWAQAEAVRRARSDQPVAGRDRVGASWPLGSTAPRVVAGPLVTVAVTGVHARGQILVLDLVARADPGRPLTLEIDLADAPDEGDDLVQSLIYARVAELMAGPRWPALVREGRLRLSL